MLWQRDTSSDCSDEDEDSAIITDGLTTNYTIENLQEDSTYRITVRVTNAVGVSVLSNTHGVKTLEAGKRL